MDIKEVKSKIEAGLGGSSAPSVALKIVRESLLVENAADLPKVVTFLKDSPDFRMDYLSSITGADYIAHLECVYHLYSMEKKDSAGVVLRVRTTDRENPKLPSLVSIYRGAEFQEREAYDMFGFIFEGHPDLRRILMWEGYEHFPMRKDYVQENSEILETSDVEWLEKNGVQVSDEIKNKAEELRKEGKQALAGPPSESEK